MLGTAALNECMCWHCTKWLSDDGDPTASVKGWMVVTHGMECLLQLQPQQCPNQCPAQLIINTAVQSQQHANKSTQQQL